MNIEIFEFKKFDDKLNVINVAFPIIAIECEANPMITKSLDAYEEAILNLVNLKLSTESIIQTLNARRGLVEAVLSELKLKGYLRKERNYPWEITNEGCAYLDGNKKNMQYKEVEFGYMFVNPIKKNVLPYFFKGNMTLFQPVKDYSNISKISISNDEAKTFPEISKKNLQFQLNNAYIKYCRFMSNQDICDDMYIEDDEIENDTQNNTESEFHDRSSFIRPLNTPVYNCYFKTRIVIDDKQLHGYSVEAPFPNSTKVFNDIFLRQFQWFQFNQTVCIGGDKFVDYIHKEIRKVFPVFSDRTEAYDTFLLRRIPSLAQNKKTFGSIYTILGEIYSSICKKESLLDMEHIVRDIASKILEKLFNIYFQRIGDSILDDIRTTAWADYKYSSKNIHSQYKSDSDGSKDIVNGMYSKVNLKINNNIKDKYFQNLLNKIGRTNGFSIMEKFYIMLLCNYYRSFPHLAKFFSCDNIDAMYDDINILNEIRNKTAHDTNEDFKSEDYEKYMDKVYGIIGNLLNGLVEE